MFGAGDAVVVLLLSTYEEAEYAPRAVECGAAAYIPKAVFGPDRLERMRRIAGLSAAASLQRGPPLLPGQVTVPSSW